VPVRSQAAVWTCLFLLEVTPSQPPEKILNKDHVQKREVSTKCTRSESVFETSSSKHLNPSRVDPRRLRASVPLQVSLEVWGEGLRVIERSEAWIQMVFEL
jgi:hypothetical protein